MEPNFNLNRPPITDDEVNAKKNFDELLKQFKKQSIQKARSDVHFLKNKKVTYSAIIAGAAVVCTVTYFSVFKKQTPQQSSNDNIATTQQTITTNNSKTNRAFITPPISKLNVPYTSYKVKTEQGAVIKHTSNSNIIIPKKAFVNKQGEEIVGDVEIRYREFHNQADIIASGIPMTYDSAGVQFHLESAGMVDIKGYQHGEPVFIHPNKQITIEFASEHTADKYNMYALDTLAKNWVYLGRDNSLNNSKLKVEDSKLKSEKNKAQTTNNLSQITSLQQQIDAIPPKMEAEKNTYTRKINQLPKTTEPEKPLKAITGRPQFKLDVNYKEFPELEAFKNAVFEVGPENKNYKNELSSITWSSAEVSEGPDKGKNYLLTLKLRQRVEKLIVYPALVGADYDKAIKTYESKFTEYKGLIDKREAEEKKLKEEFEAKQAAYLAEQKVLNEAMIKERIRIRQEQEQKLAEEYSTMGNQQRVMRIFAISNFGIYNSDCPNSMPKGASLDPIYVINNGTSTLTPRTIYLVSHDKNIVYTLDYGKLTYNPKETYSLCLLTNGKLYLCNKETFASVMKNNQNKIPVTELNSSVDNIVDFRKALGV